MIADLFMELTDLNEHPKLEAKGCQGSDLGNSFFETVCAFANEPGLGGGCIVLGVAKSGDDICDVYAVDNRTLRQLTADSFDIHTLKWNGIRSRPTALQPAALRREGAIFTAFIDRGGLRCPWLAVSLVNRGAAVSEPPVHGAAMRCATLRS